MRIGTMVRCNGGRGPARLARLEGLGFEGVQLHWWAGLGNENVEALPDSVASVWAGEGPAVHALALYGNPLLPGEEGGEARRSIRALIDAAGSFGCRDIGLFTGRLTGTPWEESLAVFVKVFSELGGRAADKGVRLLFENCPMGGTDESGDWNLAYRPDLWERLFGALPPSLVGSFGLEWEPAHQLVQGLDPLGQIADWAPLIRHVHGKDGRSEEDGIIVQTLPGNGDTDWSLLFARLREHGGSACAADIEGYHDSQWSDDKEIEGQIRSAAYLKDARDGRAVGARW